MKKVIIAFLMIIFLFLPGCSDAYKESQYSKVLNEYVYSEYLIGFNETGTAKKFKKNLLYSDNNVFEISKTNKVTNNICAYVDSDVLASLYEVKSIFEEVDNDSSIFYTDSLLRAYQIAQSKIIENIRPEFYINKNEYPIHWYDVKNNKRSIFNHEKTSESNSLPGDLAPHDLAHADAWRGCRGSHPGYRRHPRVCRGYAVGCRPGSGSRRFPHARRG